MPRTPRPASSRSALPWIRAVVGLWLLLTLFMAVVAVGLHVAGGIGGVGPALLFAGLAILAWHAPRVDRVFGRIALWLELGAAAPPGGSARHEREPYVGCE